MIGMDKKGTGKRIGKLYTWILVCIVALFVGVLLFQILKVREYTNDLAVENEISLQFHEDGTYKIMLLADIQDGADVSPYTMQLIENSLEIEKPDLVILLGDNVYGPAPDLILNKTNVEQSIQTFLQPIINADIPFCLVFGNHDGQGVMSNEEQLSYYRTFSGCMLNDEEGLTGTGNCNLFIKDSTGEKNVLNLWFFDSGSDTRIDGEKSYTCVEEDQIKWYLAKSKKITEENNGEIIPAFAFQHIPVPEIYNLLLPVEEECEGSIEKNGDIYIKNPDCTDDGFFGELPCSPIYNTGEFDAWVEAGDVMAAFFGHDHVNSFGGDYEDITMMYTPGCGFYSYGPGYNRGIRILELNEENVEDYSTHVLLYKDIVGGEINDEGALYDGYILRGKSLFSYIKLVIILPLFLIAVIIGLIVCMKKSKNGNKKC